VDYHRAVLRRERAFVSGAGWLAIAGVLLCAAAARAEPVAAGDVMRVARRVDTATFTRTFTALYAVELRRVVVADIDRDGDPDVLAATDRDLFVWLNDGSGRLISQPPARVPLVSLQSPGHSWRRDATPGRDTIQNDLPTPRLPSVRAAVPDVRSGAAESHDGVRVHALLATTAHSRAPPAAL
jgi:hypothetical protein